MTFRYNTALSKSREEYLLSFLESQEYKDVIKQKVGLELSIAKIIPKSEALKDALDTFKDYIQIALPSNKQTGKIDNIVADKTTLGNIKDRLKSVKSKRNG